MTGGEVSTMIGTGKRRVLAVGLVVAVLLALALGGWVWYRQRTPQPPLPDLTRVDPAVAAAITHGREAVHRAPHSASAWGHLGMIFSVHGFGPEARVCLQRAEQLDPREPRWPYFLGQRLLRDEPAAGLAQLQRAVALAPPGETALRLQVARNLLQEGQVEEAEAAFRSLIQADPSNPWAHLGLARIAYQRGDRPASREHLSVAAANPQTQKEAHVLLAEIDQLSEDREAAAREHALLSQLPEDPPWPDPYREEIERLHVGRTVGLGRAFTQLNQGHLQEALAEFTTLVHDYPDSEQAWCGLGYTLHGLGDAAGAEQALRSALRLAPDAKAYYHLGDALVEQGKQEEAGEAYRRAVDVNVQDGLAQLKLAQYLERKGDRAGALNAYQKVVLLRPTNVAERVKLGELLAQAGREAEAREQVEQALQLDPTNTDAQKLRQRLSPQAKGPGPS